MRPGVVLGLVCLLCVPPWANAEPPAEKQLEDAEAEFLQQQYRGAADRLKPLLHPRPQLKSPDDVVKARELLGAAYWHLQERDKAEREWQFLLIARPAFELEKFTHPKPMRLFFEKLRKLLVEQGMITRVAPVQKKPPPTVLRVVERVEHRSRATAFVPFGVPQFEYGADSWGWFFATSQGITAATSIGSLVALTLMQYQNRQGFEVGTSDHNTANALLLSTAISGAVFWGLATWGIIDANVRYEPEKLVSRTETVIKTKTVDVRTPQPQRTAKQPGGSR